MWMPNAALWRPLVRPENPCEIRVSHEPIYRGKSERMSNGRASLSRMPTATASGGEVERSPLRTYINGELNPTGVWFKERTRFAYRWNWAEDGSGIRPSFST
jgi:hypothetical protein